jgi:hypothetical protein
MVNGVIVAGILKLGTRLGEWSASRPSHFTPSGQRSHGTPWIGGWVGPKVGLDAVATRKICLCQQSKPGHPVRSLCTILTELPSQ